MRLPWNGFRQWFRIPFEFDFPAHDEIVQIAREGAPQDHQFILKPVSGEGRVSQICTETWVYSIA